MFLSKSERIETKMYEWYGKSGDNFFHENWILAPPATPICLKIKYIWPRPLPHPQAPRIIYFRPHPAPITSHKKSDPLHPRLLNVSPDLVINDVPKGNQPAYRLVSQIKSFVIVSERGNSVWYVYPKKNGIWGSQRPNIDGQYGSFKAKFVSFHLGDCVSILNFVNLLF